LPVGAAAHPQVMLQLEEAGGEAAREPALSPIRDLPATQHKQRKSVRAQSPAQPAPSGPSNSQRVRGRWQ
jgi:hypothetical protein